MNTEKELKRIRQDLQRDRLRKNYKNREILNTGNKAIKWMFIIAAILLAIIAIFIGWLVF